MHKLLTILGNFLYIIDSYMKKIINIYLQNKYSKSMKRIGKFVRFNGISYIGFPECIEIGDNVHIGNNAYISGKGGLRIGDNTHISRNLLLYTHSHEYLGSRLPYDDNDRLKKVIIGKNVWIGMNVTILPGTVIGDGSIIGAGSVVGGSVPPLAIYGASLASEIKKRDENHYNKLELKGLYGGVNGHEIGK